MRKFEQDSYRKRERYTDTHPVPLSAGYPSEEGIREQIEPLSHGSLLMAYSYSLIPETLLIT